MPVLGYDIAATGGRFVVKGTSAQAFGHQCTEECATAKQEVKAITHRHTTPHIFEIGELFTQHENPILFGEANKRRDLLVNAHEKPLLRPWDRLTSWLEVGGFGQLSDSR